VVLSDAVFGVEANDHAIYPDGSRDLVNWVRLALPEDGVPSLVAINVVWGIPSLAMEYTI
jgi:hypothetical protein